jgi:hypothetical protein
MAVVVEVNASSEFVACWHSPGGHQEAFDFFFFGAFFLAAFFISSTPDSSGVLLIMSSAMGL